LCTKRNDCSSEVERSVRDVVTGVNWLIVIGGPNRIISWHEGEVVWIESKKTDDFDLLDHDLHDFGVGNILIVRIEPELLHEKRKRDVRSHY
jgi:hypothetical protein